MKYKLIKVNLTSLDETTLKKMLSAHSDAGYIIITAFRAENDLKTNYNLNAKLKTEIKKSKYGYTVAWGGFIETNKFTGKTEQVKVQVFIVFNFKKAKSEPFDTSTDLKKLGIKWINQFEQQESFLYKPTGEHRNAFYITKAGKIDGKFTAVNPKTALDDYFTNLKKSGFNQSLDKSFTFEGNIYLPESPKSLAEAYHRYGEKFFNW